MPIRNSISEKPKQLLTASTGAILEYAQKFNPKRPMFVSQAMYDEMLKRPDLVEIMDRIKVRPAKPLP